MIKFFRRIRFDLMGKNKTGKYLKYAIGEIALVVIGILIALQINNWNEYRKLQKEELNLLFEVKSNMESTLLSFKNDTLQNYNYKLQAEKIKKYVKEDLPYHSELDTAFYKIRIWRSPYPIFTAYMTLKTKGLDIISNESLRNKVVKMNEYEFTRLSADYDKAEWVLLESVVFPFYSKHIRVNNENPSALARPIDFEFLKHNDEFQNILELIINHRKSGLKMYKNTMLDIIDLIESIEDELINRL
jgi:hypothetical protein